MKTIYRLLLLFIIVIPLYSCGEQELILEGSYSVFGSTNIIAGMSFPPYSNSEQIDFTISEIEKLAIDRIRIAVDWRNREPEQGTFYWTPMDTRMNAAEENNLSVFITIASIGPEWACLTPGADGGTRFDEEYLRTFMENLLARYDNIDKIQFGNEWESGDDDGTAYTTEESIDKFITYNNILFEAVQNFSPDTKVVLGGLTRAYPIVEYFVNDNSYPDFSGIDPANGATVEDLENRVDKLASDYNEKGIKNNIERVFLEADYDIIDIHLYDDPENWPEYLSVLPDNKPIIVSEFGGPNSEFENTNANYHAARMEDYINAIEQLPITEAYYFKLVDSEASYHKNSGLFYDNLKTKPARNVFAARLTPQ